MFDVKTDSEGNVIRWRARWVVLGNRQVGLWHATDLYAAVAHLSSMRAFFAHVAVQDLECEALDFDTAFLRAKIPEGTEIYVEQPRGLKEKGDTRVCKLRHALYGLKEAPL
ncbi:hypothetical protein IMZ48_29030 [Candidatus Bathyarchaeota archaeon]|nr:hypothetical protein [Candidatus Bathyarchaeota archaeon]